jgi:hypothetical protein
MLRLHQMFLFRLRLTAVLGLFNTLMLVVQENDEEEAEEPKSLEPQYQEMV